MYLCEDLPTISLQYSSPWEVGRMSLEAPNTGVLRLQIFGWDLCFMVTSTLEGGQGDRGYSTGVSMDEYLTHPGTTALGRRAALMIRQRVRM